MPEIREMTLQDYITKNEAFKKAVGDFVDISAKEHARIASNMLRLRRTIQILEIGIFLLAILWMLSIVHV